MAAAAAQRRMQHAVLGRGTGARGMAGAAAEPEAKRQRRRRRVGIAGYGELGRVLADAVMQDEAAAGGCSELAFVWNRSVDKITAAARVPQDKVLEDLGDFRRMRPDLVIEVAHPAITRERAADFISFCDFMPGSPSAFADPCLDSVVDSAASGGVCNALYIPSGAMWGATDIQRMAKRGSLSALRVEMRFHPQALKLQGELGARVAELLRQGESASPAETLLYEGPVRGLCPLAPNNVNTMACAALAAAPALGFDSVQGRLYAHWDHAHVVTVEAEGPPRADCGGERLRVATTRRNPAKPGAVTGTATYLSFVSSLFDACAGRPAGLHFV
eukprot:TRINITY_DN37741_c0_g1_i1.p1 TRINITY_DN37741_c0_g1~~TRINITY_DN37741_c0_g1_i1.p1  ORF type:complete len:354 (+),score=82.16 TRINITY_DN37741_c0_g1_i1:72-1064(+)